MTETLAEKTCTPCRGGVPPLARDEALRFQSQASNWELRDDDRRIERTFDFATSGKRSPSCSGSASLPRPKAITPTSASAGDRARLWRPIVLGIVLGEPLARRHGACGAAQP
jgi:hypothetical protein